jgi:crotonobetainyl-CoA:carnitine CoA-transferase CaiB-like acyl-CoA transferase
VIEARLKTRPAETWLEELEAARIPCARVNNFAQALVDPQIQHRNMVVEVEHPEGGRVKVPGNPIKLSATPAESFAPPPLLGAHTQEVFSSWAGMTEAEINTGIEAGVIG